MRFLTIASAVLKTVRSRRVSKLPWYVESSLTTTRRQFLQAEYACVVQFAHLCTPVYSLSPDINTILHLRCLSMDALSMEERRVGLIT